jgi:hypothetical protein
MASAQPSRERDIERLLENILEAAKPSPVPMAARCTA